MTHEDKYISIEWIDVEKKHLNLISTLKPGNESVNLSSYLAEWCPDCKSQISPLIKLFNDYKKLGLEMNIIMDYSSKESSLLFMNEHDVEIPFIYGELFEKNELKRLETSFYMFRQLIRDKRKWGVPFHLIRKKNSSMVGIIKGEFKDRELRDYISENL